MANDTCSVDGCEGDLYARDWCSRHYSRWRRHGDPLAYFPNAQASCTVEGCEDAHEGLGYCRVHYRRFKKTGTPHLPPERLCTVSGCEAKHWARGWCRKHYKRWRHRGGDPADNLHERPLEVRLRERLVPRGDCLEWTDGATRAGYGQIGDGEKVRYAHRVAYELWVGPIPDGLHVCHHCDNPPCCNPDHLFVGTHLDNVRDMIRKGRAAWQQRGGVG